MKLGCRYSKRELQSHLFEIFIFLLHMKSGYLQSAVVKCDWSVQRWFSCPPYPTTDWYCLQAQLNCTNGKEYHCLRDESGEWTEICAKPITCSKGQEPVLKHSQIECTNCRDPERYEPVEGTESYKYSECRRKKTTCPQDVSYECPIDEAVRHAQNRLCRCAHEKDYMPQKYDLNSETWICKEPDDLNCIHAPCPEDVYGNEQTRGPDYRCVRLSLPVTATSSKKPTQRTSPYILTQTPKRPDAQEEETESFPSLIIGVTLGILVAIILLILFFTVCWLKNRNQSDAPVSLEAKDASYFQLHLSWQPPQKGYIPTHYILEKREAGSLIWVRINMILAGENTEYQVEGLKAGTWYSFRVIAKSVKGKSKPCETESLTQTIPIRKPRMPQGLSGCFDEGQKCIMLRWDEINDDGGSEILKITVENVNCSDESASDEKWILIASITEKINTWTTSTLTGGMVYKFRVCASNAMGTSEPAITEKIKYLDVPGKPLDVYITDVSCTTLTLNWEAPENDGGSIINRYCIRQKQEKDEWQYLPEVIPSSGSKQSKSIAVNLTPLKEYYFGVGAKNRIGEGDYKDTDSSIVLRNRADRQNNGMVVKEQNVEEATEATEDISVTTMLKVVPDHFSEETPGPPEDFTVNTSGSRSCTLRWKHPKKRGGSTCTGYVVKKRESAATEWIEVEELKSEVLNCTIRELPYNKDIFFSVAAKNSFGMGQAAETYKPLTIKYSNETPGPPEDFTVNTSGSRSCTLRWKHPKKRGGSTCTGYVVKKRESAATEWIEVEELKSEVLNCTIRELPYNKDIFFSVAAKNSFGMGQAAETYKPLTIKYSNETPGPPEDFTVNTSGSRSCTLRWKHPKKRGGSTCTGYVVKKRESAATEWIEVEELKSEVLNCTIRELPYNKDIFFSVAAKNSFGMGQAAETYKPLTIKYSNENEKGCGKQAECVRQTIIDGNQGKGNEEVQSKKADGLKDETDSSVTGGDAVKTSGDAAEGLEKEEKALEILKLLKKIIHWEDFIRHATGIEPLLKDSWSIPNKTVSDLTGVAEYKTSSESLSGGLTAYECPDDGNSLFNSVSLILFGNTSHAYRLRLAAVADGIKKAEFYKYQHFGERNKDGVIQLMHSYFSKTSLEHLALDERGKEDEIRQIATRTAVRETAMPESKCNPLQVQFLSSATGFHIKQHYEKQSQAVYENVTQKSIDVVPHRLRKDTNKPSSKRDSYIHILWVSEQNQKIAGRTVINRIYPVIKKDG